MRNRAIVRLEQAELRPDPESRRWLTSFVRVDDRGVMLADGETLVRQLAANILRKLRGERTRPFSYRPLGQLSAIGYNKAVAEVLGVKVAGFVAAIAPLTLQTMGLGAQPSENTLVFNRQ